MRFEFLLPGKTKEHYIARGMDEFVKRLKHHVPVEIKILKEKGRPGKEPDEKIRREEGVRLLGRVARNSLIVALDPRGRQYSSEELADLVGQWENQGRKVVSFLIGGPLGFSPEVLARADLALSLSRMTFTHEMARLLLLEQLYRAYAIKAGTGYHK